MAFHTPAHCCVPQCAHKMRTQAGFQPQAGQLARIENGRHVAHFGQGFIQRAAQYRALLMPLGRHATLEPVTLHLGGGEHLADVVVQFTTEPMALGFLHLKHAFGQLSRLEFDRVARLSLNVPNAGDGCKVQCKQAGW